MFELSASPDGKLLIRANSGVSMASGLGWYLKYYCNSSFSWGRQGTGNLIQLNAQMPTIPLPQSRVRIVSPVKYRYYYNVCTAGYSTVWWSWQQWQEEIDRMALW